MSSLDSLVHPGALSLLNRARERYGDQIIESIPSISEVNGFIKTLQSKSAIRISERLEYCERDQTIVFSYVVKNVPQFLREEFPHRTVLVRLSTVTQDYTGRCTAPWSENHPTGWPVSECRDVFQPEHLDVIQQLFDPAQKFLLSRSDNFLHIIRRDMYQHNGIDFLAYTVEVAPRFQTEYNVNMPTLESFVSSWPEQRNFSRRRCYAEEVTFWAVLNLIPPLPHLDEIRLSIIRDAIYAVAPYCSPPHAQPRSKPRMLPTGLSIYHLLTVRYAAYRDGRARYAVAMAAFRSKSLAPHSTAPQYHKSTEDQLVLESFQNPSTSQDENQSFLSANFLSVLVLSFFTGCFGLVYLIRLRYVNEDGIDSVIGASVSISLAIMILSSSFWYWLFVGFQIYPNNAKKIVSKAITVVDRVLATTCDASRSFYNDDRLTFTGLEYTGNETYNGQIFSITDLLQTGFTTTFALDGREVLVTPGKKWLRLKALDQEGRAVFEREGSAPLDRILPVFAPPMDGEDFGRRVIPETCGKWTADLEIGDKMKLGEGLLQ